MAAHYDIKLANPFVCEQMESAVLDVLRSGHLIAGPRVAAFETTLAQRVDRSYAVMVGSGTAALYLLMRAMGIGPGSIVVVPALTFPAPALAAVQLGARLRLCDVDPRTFNMSADSLVSCLDARVSLVVGVDQFGTPCPADAIHALCASAGVPFIVDAACSLGAFLAGTPCGKWGRAAVFSFHPRKIVTTGEGGAVVTDDEDLARKLVALRNFGQRDRRFDVLSLNYRPSEIGAAMGLAQLARLDELVAWRREAAVHYRRALSIDFQGVPQGGNSNYQTLAALIPRSKIGAGIKDEARRNALMGVLATDGIETGIASYALSQVDVLKEHLCGAVDVPVALDIHRRGLALPMYYGLTSAAIARVCGAIGQWMKMDVDD